MASPQQNYSEPSLSQRRGLVIEMPSPRQLVESKGEVQYIHKRPPKAPKPPSNSPEGEGGHPDGNAKVNAKDNAYVSDNAKANAKANVSLFPNSLFHRFEKLLAINQVNALFVTLRMFEKFGSYLAIGTIGIDIVLGMNTWQLLWHHVVVSECVE